MADERSLPCGSCPWRVDADATRIPGLSVERARGLDATCPTSESLFGTPMMACHHSDDGDESVCIGWALSDASRDSIPLRLAMMHGTVAGWRVLRDAAERADVVVYDSFADMLEQIEATAGDTA